MIRERGHWEGKTSLGHGGNNCWPSEYDAYPMVCGGKVEVADCHDTSTDVLVLRQLSGVPIEAR
jgi:hypothetical protein